MVDWSQTRFDSICATLKTFLKSVGFSNSNVWYVPVSGMLGENLAVKAKIPGTLSLSGSSVAYHAFFFLTHLFLLHAIFRADCLV